MSTLHQLAIGLNVSEKTLHSWNKNFKIILLQNEHGELCYTAEQKELLLRIHHLIKERGFTIKGAKMELKKEPLDDKPISIIQRLTEIRDFLTEIKEKLPH